ncbi:hypothetical protein D9M73_128250 [compost metagenome]
MRQVVVRIGEVIGGVGQITDEVDGRAVGAKGIAERQLGLGVEQIFGVAAADCTAPPAREVDLGAAAAFPIGEEIQVVGLQAGVADVGIELCALAGRRAERGGIDDAIRDVGRLQHVTGPGDGDGVHRLAVIVVIAVNVQPVEGQRQVRCRTILHGARHGLALARLLEIGIVDAERCHRLDQVFLGTTGDRRIGVLQDALARRVALYGAVGILLEEVRAALIAEEFHARARDGLLVIATRDQDAEGVVLVLPAVQARTAEIALVRTIIVAVAARGEDGICRRVERTARAHDDGAAKAALFDARLRRLVHFEALDQFRGEQ